MADKDPRAPSGSTDETLPPTQTIPTPPQTAEVRLQQFMLSFAQSQKGKAEERRQRTAEMA